MGEFSAVEVLPERRLVMVKDEHSRHHLATVVGAAPVAGAEVVGELQPNAVALPKAVDSGDTLPMVFVIINVRPEVGHALLGR